MKKFASPIFQQYFIPVPVLNLVCMHVHVHVMDHVDVATKYW
eukprot:SAG11_NODE_18783_length_481_cov_1.062827_1_plen_41_part_01